MNKCKMSISNLLNDDTRENVCPQFEWVNFSITLQHKTKPLSCN